MVCANLLWWGVNERKRLFTNNHRTLTGWLECCLGLAFRSALGHWAGSRERGTVWSKEISAEKHSVARELRELAQTHKHSHKRSTNEHVQNTVLWFHSLLKETTLKRIKYVCNIIYYRTFLSTVQNSIQFYVAFFVTKLYRNILAVINCNHINV